MKLTRRTDNLGIDYEWVPPYTETYTQTDSEIMANMMIRDVAVDRFLFPVAMLGDAIWATDAEGKARGFIFRTIPQRHPQKKWFYAAECKLVEGKGAWRTSKQSGVIEFFSNYADDKDVPDKDPGFLIYEVTFRPPPYEILRDDQIRTELDRWVVKNFKPSIESYQLPGNLFGWQQGEPQVNKPTPKIITIPEPISKQRPMMELHYTWHWVPEPIPLKAIVETMGKINLNPFDNQSADKSINTAFESGHLLCAPPEISDRYYTPFGNRVRNISFIFYFRQDTTWNQFLRKETGEFVTIGKLKKLTIVPTRLAFTGDGPYAEADFSKMFEAPATV